MNPTHRKNKVTASRTGIEINDVIPAFRYRFKAHETDVIRCESELFGESARCTVGHISMSSFFFSGRQARYSRSARVSRWPSQRVTTVAFTRWAHA